MKDQTKYNLEHIEVATNAMVSGLEQKHPYSKGHSFGVSTLAYALANALPYLKRNPQRIVWMRIAGLLHDIGKICVEESTLNNQTRHLNDDQISQIEDHPHDGAQIVRKSRTLFPKDVIDGIMFHHEHYDGSHDGNMRGYPLGYSGKDIPLAGRIIAIADTFNAMITTRTYQQKVSIIEAVAVLQSMAGKQLDPYLVKVFIKKVVPTLLPQ